MNQTPQSGSLTHVSRNCKLIRMKKTHALRRKEKLDGLREAAARPGRSVAETGRKFVLRPTSSGPVAIWDGEPKRTSIEHDIVHDET